MFETFLRFLKIFYLNSMVNIAKLLGKCAKFMQKLPKIRFTWNPFQT